MSYDVGRTDFYCSHLKIIKCDMTSAEQIFTIYLPLNWKFSILKYVFGVYSPED